MVVRREFGQPPGTRSQLVRLGEAEGSTLIETPAPKVLLFDAVRVGGTTRLLYATEDDATPNEPSGDLFVLDLGGEPRRITGAFGPEYFMERASFGGEVVVTSSICDLTECFAFYGLDGTEIEDRPNPTDTLAYNALPFMTQAVLSPDGSSLAYLEGPDVDGAGDPLERVGEWELVVVDQHDGAETLRLRVAPNEVEVVWLDFDGRWVIMSVEDEARLPAPVVVVDTQADRPAPRELPDVVGIATIAAE